MLSFVPTITRKMSAMISESCINGFVHHISMTNLFYKHSYSKLNQINCGFKFARASVVFWSIWLTRNDTIFDKKNITLFFIDYFDGELLDTVLVHFPKEDYDN